MFQFPGFASPAYEFSRRYRRSGGLPHSEIHGSMPARGSPWLIATCCVLHRLSVPRHPPDALQTLDLNITNAPRAGESPQGTCSPARRRIRQRCIIMTQPTAPSCEATALSGHPRSLILFTCQRSHTRPQADICVLSRGYPVAYLLVSDFARSLKVTVRHSALLLVEADGIEPTTSCLQSTRSPN